MQGTAGVRTGTGTAPVVELERGAATGKTQAALVVGYDRAAPSMAALSKAAEIGEQLEAELHVVHAVDLADYPVDPDADDWEEQAAKSLEEDRHKVSDALADYPFGWSYLALRADPAEALNRVADQFEAVMIVVGIRSAGRLRLLERLSGPSVSHRLISHCHRPVLVVSSHGPS